jgi:hypothetical protein
MDRKVQKKAGRLVEKMLRRPGPASEPEQFRA